MTLGRQHGRDEGLNPAAGIRGSGKMLDRAATFPAGVQKVDRVDLLDAFAPNGPGLHVETERDQSQ